jgi:hypothetical protein
MWWQTTNSKKKIVFHSEEFFFYDNSTHILSTNQIYEIGQYGPITLVLKKLPPEIF